MSTESVFETFELLEQILLELPMLDLLISQHVSRKWKETISTSKALQKALFFLPVTDHCAIFRDDTAYSSDGYAPLRSTWRVPEKYGTNYYFLCRSDLVRQLLCRASRGEETHPPRDLIPFRETDVYLNPILLSHFPWSRWLFSSSMTTTTSDDTNNDDQQAQQPTSSAPEPLANPHRYTAYYLPGMTHPTASWKRMLISQPPLGGLTTIDNSGDWACRVLSATDVRFAMLYGFNGELITIERLRRFMDGLSNRVLEVKGKERLLTWGNGEEGLRRVRESIREREVRVEIDIGLYDLSLDDTDR